ncbi:MAG: PEP-CTERM sorting domain-containing protein [bacterium]|nr:PEP-CTERM sorting domain-containing protein [bacterium]
MRCQRFTRLCILSAFLCTSWSAHYVSAAVTTTHSYIPSFDKKPVFDFAFMKSVKDKLGGLYHNLQIVVAACKSGGFADEATKRLGGKYSVATSRNKVEIEKFLPYYSKMYKGKEGYRHRIDPPGYAHGWEPQWAKKLLDDKNATAKQLFDAAVANDYDSERATARFVSKNDGKLAKIKDGPDGSRALVWYNWGDLGAGSWAVVDSLTKAGYSDTEIDWAYRNAKGAEIGHETKYIPDRNATKQDLTNQLWTMKTFLQTAGDQKAFILLSGHGSVAKLKAEEVPERADSGIGVQYFHDNSLTLELDTEFVTDLFEDLAVLGDLDDPDVVREGEPTIIVNTAEEYDAGGSGIVQVLIDDLFIGAFELEGTGFNSYSLDIDDATLTSLYDSLNGDLVAEVKFLMDDGAWFRVASDDNFEAGLTESFGIMLAGPGLRGIPEPSSLTILGLGVAAFLKRSR